jgi:hypothetical protein
MTPTETAQAVTIAPFKHGGSYNSILYNSKNSNSCIQSLFIGVV